MSMNTLCKPEGALVASLFLLAGGAFSLRFHYDFLSGFGISAGVAVVAISALKRHRASIS